MMVANIASSDFLVFLGIPVTTAPSVITCYQRFFSVSFWHLQRVITCYYQLSRVAPVILVNSIQLTSVSTNYLIFLLFCSLQSIYHNSISYYMMQTVIPCQFLAFMSPKLLKLYIANYLHRGLSKHQEVSSIPVTKVTTLIVVVFGTFLVQ